MKRKGGKYSRLKTRFVFKTSNKTGGVEFKITEQFRGESKFTTVLMSKTFSKSHLKVVISIHRSYNTGDETRNESLQINEI